MCLKLPAKQKHKQRCEIKPGKIVSFCSVSIKSFSNNNQTLQNLYIFIMIYANRMIWSSALLHRSVRIILILLWNSLNPCPNTQTGEGTVRIKPKDVCVSALGAAKGLKRWKTKRSLFYLKEKRDRKVTEPGTAVLHRSLGDNVLQRWCTPKKISDFTQTRLVKPLPGKLISQHKQSKGYPFLCDLPKDS